VFRIKFIVAYINAKSKKNSLVITILVMVVEDNHNLKFRTSYTVCARARAHVGLGTCFIKMRRTSLMLCRASNLPMFPLYIQNRLQQRTLVHVQGAGF